MGGACPAGLQGVADERHFRVGRKNLPGEAGLGRRGGHFVGVYELDAFGEDGHGRGLRYQLRYKPGGHCYVAWLTFVPLGGTYTDNVLRSDSFWLRSIPFSGTRLFVSAKEANFSGEARRNLQGNDLFQ